ncbi:MAG: methyltransferase [Methylococcaceae bacterium]|nr:methyltransferase [Methylococcaceae bacterium]
MSIQTENTLSVNQGRFELHRFPQRPRELLRAWDAADEYLLDYLADQGLPEREQSVLIINDTFGALAVALSAYKPTALSDSYLSQLATRCNLDVNKLPEERVKLVNSLENLEGMYDLVLLKAPKTLALLEDELIRLRPHVTPATKIILAGMIKTLSPSVWTLLERLLGATQTSLARKKARLIYVSTELASRDTENSYPIYYRLENTGYLICNHANVFSREKLDIGTRFFLQHLPSKPGAKDIIDLGCGNGLVGLVAAERNPLATLHFVDESYMAVASAHENFNRAFGQERIATFSVGDGLSDFASNSADLILCNPPFHQQNTIGDQIAISMFKQSRRVLRKNGELWVIGNRHLKYQQPLARLFGRCSVVGGNSKFEILKTNC